MHPDLHHLGMLAVSLVGILPFLMAVSPFTTQRGAVGSVVYQNGRFGPIARERVRPVNPRTSHQQTQKNILATVASQWRGITAAQRNSFRALADRLPEILWGFNAFTKGTAPRVTGEKAVVTDAPQPPSFGIL